MNLNKLSEMTEDQLKLVSEAVQSELKKKELKIGDRVKCGPHNGIVKELMPRFGGHLRKHHYGIEAKRTDGTTYIFYATKRELTVVKRKVPITQIPDNF